MTDPGWAVIGEQERLRLGPSDQASEGVRTPNLQTETDGVGGFYTVVTDSQGLRQHPGSQIVVPVGMSDLLDDWLWSPDAARWDPDVAMGNDSERSPLLTWRGWVRNRAFEEAMEALMQACLRVNASFERFQLGTVPTVEVLDETVRSGPPTNVRGGPCGSGSTGTQGRHDLEAPGTSDD